MDQHKKYIWHFLRAYFEQNPTSELLNLLGYSIADVNEKLNQHVDVSNELSNNVNDLNDQFANLNQVGSKVCLDVFRKSYTIVA